MTPEDFVELNKCYCAVSGSPVRPSEYNRYGLLLDAATDAAVDPLSPLSVDGELSLSSCSSQGQKVFGFMHYCCWPCVCDTLDYIKADTKTLTFMGGEQRTFHFAVIGDPCKGPGIHMESDLLSYEVPDSFGYRRGATSTVGTTAPEIHCERADDSADMHLQGATMSDHGHPIIAMLFDAVSAEGAGKDDVRFQMQLAEAPQPGKMRRDPRGNMYQHHHEYVQMCTDRIVDGVATSGMGDIFRVLANITKVPTRSCTGL